MNKLSLACLLSLLPALAAANPPAAEYTAGNGVSANPDWIVDALTKIQNGDKVSGSKFQGMGLTASGNLTQKGDVTLTGSFVSTSRGDSLNRASCTVKTFTIHLTLDDAGNVVAMNAQEKVQSATGSDVSSARENALNRSGTTTSWTTDPAAKTGGTAARGEKPKSTIPSEEKPSFVGQTNPKQQQAVACGGTVSPSSPDCQ